MQHLGVLKQPLQLVCLYSRYFRQISSGPISQYLSAVWLQPLKYSPLVISLSTSSLLRIIIIIIEKFIFLLLYRFLIIFLLASYCGIRGIFKLYIAFISFFTKFSLFRLLRQRFSYIRQILSLNYSSAQLIPIIFASY